MDLLISYSWGQFYRVNPEVIRILKAFGDPKPEVGKTAVMGVAIAHTNLNNREVIRHCHALWKEQPLDSFEFAIKWVPVDHWCLTDLEEIKWLIDHKISAQIRQDQTWGMKVYKRRWQQYHTSEIVEKLAADIDRKVDLSKPDLILWVDIVGNRTAVSLLKPDEIFSIRLPSP
jgi:tRNA(Ser,Leu) C12 N-acetylase TAN1